MTADPEGGVWFTMAESAGVGRISPGGEISGNCFPEAFPASNGATSIAYGSDSALWFIAPYAFPSSGLVGRMTTSGAFSYYPAEAEEPVIRDLISGPGGTIWFTSEPSNLEPGHDHGAIDTITPSGIVTRYALPEGVVPNSIAAGPDGGLWFVATGIGNCGSGVGRLAPAGTVTYYDLSDTPAGCPPPLESTIVAGPDGAMWLNAGGSVDGGVSVAAGGDLTRITTSTPGSSTPRTMAPTTQLRVTSTVVHPIVVPPDVKRTLDTAKLDAEVSKHAVDLTDTGMLVFKLAVAVAEPELAFEMLMPDQFDAAQFLIETQLTGLAADPPRNDFTQIASPAYLPFGNVTAYASRTDQRTRAWTRLTSDTQSAAMYMRAFTLSVERLQGAAVQGECAWMQRQAQAARANANGARRSLAHELLDVKRLRAALAAAGIHNPSISASQFRVTQARVARKGLPADMTAALRRSGLGSAEVSQVMTSVVHAKPHSVHFLRALEQTRMGLPKLVRALKAFASVTGHSVACTAA